MHFLATIPTSTHFFSMKTAYSGKIVLVTYIVDFDDIQVWIRLFSLVLNASKVMMIFLKIRPNFEGRHNFADIEIHAEQS